MDYTQTFETYLRVEKGRAASTIAAYLGDVRRFRQWLDEQAEQGVAIAWEEVKPRHAESISPSLRAARATSAG